jgi:hypothetical protein
MVVLAKQENPWNPSIFFPKKNKQKKMRESKGYFFSCFLVRSLSLNVSSPWHSTFNPPTLSSSLWAVSLAIKAAQLTPLARPFSEW